MYLIRSYRPDDLDACTVCLIEGFFDVCGENDRAFMKDYTQVLIEMSSFTFVAEEEGAVRGFICGQYKKGFSKELAKRSDHKRHYGMFVKLYFKFLLNLYKMSPEFKKEFDIFFAKMKERPNNIMDDCDCELFTLTSMKDHRKGIGTAMTDAFMRRCTDDGASRIKVLTNTASTYGFYKKYGTVAYEKEYDVKGCLGSTLIYEIGPRPEASGL